MPREYKLRVGRGQQKIEPLPDDLPTHRSVGDQFTFPYADRMWVGEVVAVKDVLTSLIRADGEMFYERGQDITHLPISAACPHCGQFAFLCADECPAKSRKPRKQTDKNMSKKDILTIADVLAIEPGTDKDPAWVNDIVECVVSNVKEAKGKGPVKATLSMASDKDTKITGIFWKRDFEEIEKLDGKLVRIEDGMIRSIYKPEKGPKIHQLAVMAKAEIEEIGQSSDSERPLPHGRGQAPDNGRDAAASSSVRSGGIQTDVLRRARCYFGVFLRVEKAHDEAVAAGLRSKLTPADLKDITTHISMTYRGDYGCYAEPLFEKNGASHKKLEEMEEQTWDDEDVPHGDREDKGPQSTERTSSWKKFEVNGKPLGELETGNLLKKARWAMTVDRDDVDPKLKLAYANLLTMMTEKKWDKPDRLLANSFAEHPEYNGAFIDEDIDAFLQKEYGKDLAELDEEEALGVIADFDNVIEGVIKSKAKEPAAKKAKAAMPD